MAEIEGIEFEVKGSAGKASAAMETLTAALVKFKQMASGFALGNVTKALRKLGEGAKKAGKSLLSMPFKRVADSAKSLNGKLGTLLSSLKRIAFYRIIRTMIKEIGQAFKEGTDNLYAWSKAIGGTFADSMDTITTSMNYFKNSIGAAVAPIVNALAPAIDFIVDKIVALINLINQLFALLTGAKFWTRAKKNASEYGNAVGGAGAAAKEALRYLAPFDELNVLPDDRDGGGGGGGADAYSDMFEQVDTFSENIKDFADKLREAFNNADWKTLGSLLGNKVNELVDYIPFAELGKKVGFGINGWFSTKYWTLETINFRKIGRKIAEFLNNMLDEIDFNTIGRTITQPFTMLGDFIIGALYNVDWHLVGKSIRDFVVGTFSQLSDWLDTINWAEFGDRLMTAIINFIDGLDPIEVSGKLIGFFAKVLYAVEEVLQGMVANLWNRVVDKNPWLEKVGLGKVDAYTSRIMDDLGNAYEYNTKTGQLEVVANVTGIKNSLPRGQRGSLQNVTANVTNTTEYGLKKSIDNVTANLTNTTVSASFPRTITGLVAQLKSWEKANGFNSTVSNMVSQFASWAKANGFSSTVNNMISGFSSWAKASGYSSTITNMVSSFSNYLKANGYPTTVTGMISSFTSWAKASGYSSTIGSMISSFSSWAKANGFNNTITGFTAALSSYLKQFDDPTIRAVASIMEAFDWTNGGTILDAIARITSANPALANDPVISAIASILIAQDKLDYYPYVDVIGNIIMAEEVGQSSYSVNEANERARRDNDKLAAHYSALGGIFSNGFWSSIPQFANGGALHGSLFLAGEAGAELVGHVGGRTEVLNRSQLASTMYASVRNAMSGVHINASVPSVEARSDEDTEELMYRAFRRALDETDFGGSMEVDGEALFHSMVRRNNQNTRMTGVNAFA